MEGREGEKLSLFGSKNGKEEKKKKLASCLMKKNDKIPIKSDFVILVRWFNTNLYTKKFTYFKGGGTKI